MASPLVHAMPPRYEPIRILGAGGGGEVWEVRDRLTEVRLALKILGGHAGKHETEALVREFVTLSGLEGLGLPRVHRFGRLADSEQPYVLRELIPGTSLDQVLPSEPGRALEALAQVAEQLTVLHRVGVLHGDIKPANVICREAGPATLVDFGLASHSSGNGAPHGLTPRYAAPEIFAGQPLTVRAEVYSLGLVLRDITEHLQLDEYPLSVIDALALVVDRATAADAIQRYPSTDEFAAALRLAANLPEQVYSSASRLAWPILGIDAIFAKLLAHTLALSAGESLSIQGVVGSGKSILLRKLAWSLGVSGESLFYADSDLVSDLAAFDAELSHASESGVVFVLVDDAIRLKDAQRAELMRLTRSGARLVVVGNFSAERSTTPMIVPPLERGVASELLLHAIPSLTPGALDKILEVSQCRPLALRQWISRIKEGTLTSSDEVLELQEKGADCPAIPQQISMQLLRQTLDKGRFKEGLRMLDELAPEFGHTAEWAIAKARVQLGIGEPRRALGALEPHMDQRERLAEPCASEVWLCCARASLGIGDYAGAIDAARKVAKNDPGIYAEALIQTGLGECYLGRAELSRDVITQALKLAEAHGNKRVEALACAARGFVAQRDNRLDDALAAYEGAIACGQESADASVLANAELNLAGLLHMRGDVAGAIEHFEAAVDRGERAGRQATVRQALLNLANLDLFLGRLARAQSRLEMLQADGAELAPAHEAQRLGLAAELHARLGNGSQAEQLFAQCAQAYEVLGRDADAAEARLEGVLVSAEASSVDPNKLNAEVEYAKERLGNSSIHEPLARLAEGRVALRAGNEAAARRAIEQSVKSARESNHRELLWRALEAQADLEQAAGGLLRARHLREEALSLLEEMAASLPRDLREVYWSDPRRRGLRAATHSGDSTPSNYLSPVVTPVNREITGSISTWLSNPIDPRLAKILELNAELVGDLNLESVTERIIDTAVRLSGAELGLVILRESDGPLRVLSSRSTTPDAVRVRFSTTIAETAISTAQPIVTMSARDDQRMSSWASVHELMVQSVACVPIRAGKTGTIGALYLETRMRPGARFQSELPMLQAFADQVAIALHSAKLLEENKAKAEALTESNRQLSEAQERLKELLGNRTQQLHRTRRQLKETRETLYGHFGYHGLVGTSEAMRRIYALVDRVKSADIAVLITGESGTGKEMVARAIHAASDRCRGPFIGVNCGAIPENLLESELFGSVRGAFTGADRDRSGLFRESQGGTILLDEIGEMPTKMQSGLLRVLQTKTVRPVGGRREEPVDVRVICATHRNLEELVRAGVFREDLYYRIHVVEIRVPSLREHPEDIPQLVNHFSGLFSAKFRQDRKVVSREALRLLMDQPWRGNIRELEHVLLNAWIMSDDEELCPRDFELPASTTSSRTKVEFEHEESSGEPSACPSERGTSRASVSRSDPVPNRAVKLRKGTDEKDLILEALRACDHNKVKAAQMVGIPRRTFYRRLEAYGIK